MPGADLRQIARRLEKSAMREGAVWVDAYPDDPCSSHLRQMDEG